MDARRHETRLRQAEAFTVVARLGVALLFGWGALASERALADAERTHVVMATLERTRSSQVDVRLHHRGFLLTGDVREQQEVRRAEAQLDSNLATLRTLKGHQPAWAGQVDAVTQSILRANSIRAKVMEASQAVTADSLRSIYTASGLASLSDSIEAQLNGLTRSERSLLSVNSDRQHRALRLAMGIAAVTAIIAALMGVVTLRVRRRNTQAIAASATTFQRLAEDNPDGVLVHIDYEVVYANPAAEALLRVAETPLVGRRVPAMVHPDDRGVIDERTAHVTGAGKPTAPRLIRFLRDDGGVCEAEARGAPITFDGKQAVQVVLRDMTARRDAEQALQRSEQRFRAVLNAMSEGVVWHGPDMAIGLSNPAAQRILGLTEEQLHGRTPTDPAWRTVDVDRNPLPPDQHFASVSMRTGQPASGIMGVERCGLPTLWIMVNAVPVFRDDQRTPAGVVVTFADITARVQLEEQLRQAQKMEVMGRMASGVAHDFNNLLTIIRASSELLRVDARSAGVTFDTLDDIESATDRAAALTAHLLTFSRRQHAAPVPLNPAQQVSGAMPILRRLAGDAVTIEHHSETGSEGAWVWADPVRFEQVLVNLVSNAKDAMPAGGNVRIRTGVAALQESVVHRFGTINAGRYVTLSVEDAGTGMTSEVLDHLFDPFYTTKPQGRGTGLGLSIVYGVVHEALGTITVQTEPGRGSRLTVYWPRAETPADATVPAATPPVTRSVTAATAAAPKPVSKPAARATSTSSSSTDRRDLVLLVDDEESVRRVVAKQLEASGYAVITAESGRSALAMLRHDSLAIRAVISDVRMPEMSGIELVYAMADEQIRCPILLVSGQMDTQLPREWPDGAVVRFLPKPLSGIALRRAVTELLTMAPDVARSPV